MSRDRKRGEQAEGGGERLKGTWRSGKRLGGEQRWKGRAEMRRTGNVGRHLREGERQKEGRGHRRQQCTGKKSGEKIEQ